MTTVPADITAAAGITSEVPWITIPDLCEKYALNGSKVRRLISDRVVLGVKLGRPAVFYLPEDFFQEAVGQVEAVEGLAGTITALSDAGFSDVEIIDWLHTHDAVLQESPIAALRAGRRKPVRRSAQLLF